MGFRSLAYSIALALSVAGSAQALDLQTATIADVNAAFKQGSLTSEKLVAAYLKRIEAYDKQGPTINAVIR